MKILPGIFISMVVVILTGSWVRPAQADSWTTAKSMLTPRWAHSATLLPNGQVLVAGGSNTFAAVPILASAELYDPAAGTWSATGPMNTARAGHTATLLPNGKVLVAGGDGSNWWSIINNAELYDPATGAWTPTGALNVPRSHHTATLLLNGQVLVTGGSPDIDGNATNHCELYNPATGQWTVTGALNTPRVYHTATLLPNGQVLVTGGITNLLQPYAPTATVEFYNPATGTWSPGPSMITARSGHSARLLANGNVLVAGPAGAELWLQTPKTNNVWLATGAVTGDVDINTILLPNGTVLAVYGAWFNPVNNRWTAAAALSVALNDLTTTLLTNGQVLVAGGKDNSLAATNGVELYDSVNSPVTEIGQLYPAIMADGSARVAFASNPHGTPQVLATGNLVNWVKAGTATEYAPGLFVFTDPQATNHPQYFYRASSP